MSNTSHPFMDCLKMVFNLFPNWKRATEVKKLGYKLHGNPFSTNTRRVLAVLLEKGLSYEPITVDLKTGEHKKDSFLGLNPFGQVPVLEDGNLTLCESRAITQYIAYVHSSRGTQLLNLQSHETMAILTMWMEIEAHQFDPLASKLTWELVIKPLYGLETDHMVVKENEAGLEKVLDVYEKRLGESRFLACNTFTLVDLHHLPNIQFLLGTPTKRLFENRPKVRNWVHEITSREAWKMACDPENSSKLSVTLALMIVIMSISYEAYALAPKDGYKIYGYPSSPNTRRALAVLHEKGLSFDRITVNLTTGDQQKPSFLPINPFGQVPVFLDGHLKLIEQTIKPLKGLKADYKVVNETETKLGKVLDIYEERLKNSRFLASNRFTLADLFHLPNIEYLMNTTTKRLFETRPNVHRWVAKITARPAWKKACDAKAWYDKKKNYTWRVLAVLHEKGLSYYPITVNLRTGEQKKPSFLSINPFGQVPVLLDGHLKLTESRAISLYIESAHRSRGTKLLNHKNYKKMGIETMWMYIESFEFDPPATTLTFEQAIKPMTGLKTDYKVVNETEPQLEKVLDIYEERLKNSRFLAGNRFTLADLFHLPNIEYLMNTTTKRLFESRPNSMAGIKVFGHPASTATRRVLIALHEKELDFELVHIDLKDGEHKKEPFLSRNPFGKIPAFEDGGFKLFESRAITQYIAHEYADKGNQLLSPGSKNMAILAMGMEIEAHEFDSVASKLGWEQIFKNFFGLTTDQAVVKEEEVKLGKVLDNYEARLGESKYLACDHFTLVDLHHIPVIQYLLGTPTKKLFDERPHVSAWVADITSRPSSQKVLL
ncbi:hypothetical protein IGI04_039281 [Brassica rapa subsp. trilocularis]|nr:hypothetical protein IGI04_039281 [Brassica rapa subsp. trilocularis]